MRKLIDKQQAVDALGERPMIWTEDDYELGQANQYDADKAAIENLNGICKSNGGCAPERRIE